MVSIFEVNKMQKLCRGTVIDLKKITLLLNSEGPEKPRNETENVTQAPEPEPEPPLPCCNCTNGILPPGSVPFGGFNGDPNFGNGTEDFQELLGSTNQTNFTPGAPMNNQNSNRTNNAPGAGGGTPSQQGNPGAGKQVGKPAAPTPLGKSAGSNSPQITKVNSGQQAAPPPVSNSTLPKGKAKRSVLKMDTGKNFTDNPTFHKKDREGTIFIQQEISGNHRMKEGKKIGDMMRVESGRRETGNINAVEGKVVIRTTDDFTRPGLINETHVMSRGSGSDRVKAPLISTDTSVNRGRLRHGSQDSNLIQETEAKGITQNITVDSYNSGNSSRLSGPPIPARIFGNVHNQRQKLSNVSVGLYGEYNNRTKLSPQRNTPHSIPKHDTSGIDEIRKLLKKVIAKLKVLEQSQSMQVSSIDHQSKNNKSQLFLGPMNISQNSFSADAFADHRSENYANRPTKSESDHKIRGKAITLYQDEKKQEDHVSYGQALNEYNISQPLKNW